MSVAVLGLVLAIGTATPDAFAEVQALLAERRLEEAHSRLAEIADPVLAARAEADLWYYGRDFQACRVAAREGLERSPEDLYLWNRLAGASLWIRDGAGAQEACNGLLSALGASTLPPEDRAWWESNASALAEQSEALLAASAERDRRIRSSRLVSLGALGVVLAGMAVLAMSGSSPSGGAGRQPVQG